MAAAPQHFCPCRAVRAHGGSPRRMGGVVRASLPVWLLLALVLAAALWLAWPQRQQLPATPAHPATVNTPAASPNGAVAFTGAAGSAIRLGELPAIGQQVYQRIHQGGTFAFDKDGSVFGNREGLLPKQARGYYREYTVAQSNADNRGARRIVCGGEPRQPEVCYYTADHYDSFKRIVP